MEVLPVLQVVYNYFTQNCEECSETPLQNNQHKWDTPARAHWRQAKNSLVD